uniref:Putative secreted protein n=1 Tax=Amblyomma parvum TaxID=251391 RepID=A0A023G279_AMBPA
MLLALFCLSAFSIVPLDACLDVKCLAVPCSNKCTCTGPAVCKHAAGHCQIYQACVFVEYDFLVPVLGLAETCTLGKRGACLHSSCEVLCLVFNLPPLSVVISR